MKRYYTVKEASKLLGVSTNTVYKYLDDGKLKGKRIGQGRFKIPYSELLPFIGADSEALSLLALPRRIPTVSEFLGAFHGIAYNRFDFVLFKLFLALIFLGNGLLTLFYRLSLFTPTESLIFVLIPFITLTPGILILFEIFWEGGRENRLLIQALAVIVASYSVYFAFSFRGLEVFSVFLATLVILVSQVLRGLKNLDEKTTFEKEFLGFLLVLSVIWGIILLVKPDLFPIFTLKQLFMAERVFLGIFWFSILVLPLIVLFVAKARRTNLDLVILPFLSLLAIVGGVYISSEGKWIASYFVYLIAIFELFLLWWRRQTQTVSARFAPFFALGLFWIISILFLGIFGVALAQRSVIDARTARIQGTLSDTAREINFLFETIDRRLITAVQRSDIVATVISGDEETAIAKSKEIFDVIPNLRRVSILNSKGRVLGAYPRDPVLQGADLSGRDYFQIAKSSLKPYTSGIFTAVTGMPVVVHVYPITRGNDFLGLVAAVPDLVGLSKDYNPEGEIASFYGFDKNGNYVLHPDPQKLGTKIPQEVGEQAKEEIYRDVSVFRVFEKMGGNGWTLYAQGPLPSLLRNLWGVSAVLGGLILTTTVLSLGALSLIAKKWTRT